MLQVLGTLITVLVVDRAGRRLLLLLSEFCVALSMLGVGVFFLLQEHCTAPDCGTSTTTPSPANSTMPGFTVSPDTVRRALNTMFPSINL